MLVSDPDARQMWQAVLGELQLQVPRPSFETWLKDTVGLRLNNGSLTVGARTPFAIEWLEKRIYALVEQTVEAVAARPLEVDFCVLRDNSPATSPQADASDEPLGPTPPSAPCGAGLNPHYTFSTFIVGKSNQLAHAAAQAVARAPGHSYNPLVIYSGVGLGKTHLTHAVGHAVCTRGLNPLYVTAEQFTNDFVRSIQRGQMDEFRAKYRQIDLLLIDDIQFIAGKEHSQEAFFHTFNELHTSNRQVVVTSDRPPRALTMMEDRLRSRFHGGLLVDIKAPELETRLAILRSKAETLGAFVPPEVLEYIARKVQKNVRELEGSLNRVVAFADLTQQPITEETAAQVMADLVLQSRRRALPPEQVISTVAAFYDVPPDVLRARRRDKRTARARQVAMYLLREEANRSLSEIGRLLGGRDHTTVIHACGAVSQLMQEDGQLRSDILVLLDRLTGSP